MMHALHVAIGADRRLAKTLAHSAMEDGAVALSRVGQRQNQHANRMRGARFIIALVVDTPIPSPL